MTLGFTHVTHPLINGHIKNHQCDEREHVVYEEIHPMDIQSDIKLVAPQFGWANAVHRDIPMRLVIYFDFPESINSKIKFSINLHSNSEFCYSQIQQVSK